MSSMDASISPESQIQSQSNPPTASPPMSQPPVTVKDTAEDFHEEEDKLDYTMLNNISLTIPRVSCPEKIIICIDPCIETAGHVLKSKDGSNQESLINICKNAVEMFICTKSAIDKRHQFALVTLFNIAAWTRDLTTSKEDVIRDLRHLDPTDVQDIFDLTSLFATVQSKVTLPTPSNLKTTPPYTVRVVFFYCRSECLPLFLNGRDSQRMLLENPYFFFDVVYIHKPIIPERNRCRAIQESLWNIDRRARSYQLDVTQSMTSLYDALAKILGHPLQRPLMKDLNNKLVTVLS